MRKEEAAGVYWIAKCQNADCDNRKHAAIRALFDGIYFARCPQCGEIWLIQKS